jgi:hypothetical protein
MAVCTPFSLSVCPGGQQTGSTASFCELSMSKKLSFPQGAQSMALETELNQAG